MRVGIGFDAHRFGKGRPLILGGLEIPFHLGLEGHSDADVVIHAVMDAILGAVAAGDIGEHFPDNDDRYRDISSLVLLSEVAGLVEQQGFQIGNIDVAVVLEKPRLSPYREQMQKRIAQALNLEVKKIGIKATTTEGMGFAGRGEGIAAYAVALVEETG
jgi:2-C-methyl-D-erythritol 2,4-cyclodiphosphate synthase